MTAERGVGFDFFPSLVRAVEDAERAFAQAEEVWEEVSAEYRAEFEERTRPVLDERGLQTGEHEALSRVDAFELSRVEKREAAAWEARQRAKDDLEHAERLLNGGWL